MEPVRKRVRLWGACHVRWQSRDETKPKSFEGCEVEWSKLIIRKLRFRVGVGEVKGGR